MTKTSSSSLTKGSMGTQVYRRKTCRLCDASDITLVLQLTPTPPVDAFVPNSRLTELQELYPIDVFLCNDCGHVQLLDVVNPKLLFGDYIYLTSSSPGLVEHFRRYADDILKFVDPAPNSLVVEIGSNDGTLLNFFKESKMRVLGVDPASGIAQTATRQGLLTLPHFFTSHLAKDIEQEHGPATIVCANNVFAHADDLADMAEGVRQLLAPNGFFVFEVSYLLDMINGMVFDFIYHEHLCYHSVKPLQRFLRKHGMELFNVTSVPTHGGSIRVFAQLLNGSRKLNPSVVQMLQQEAKAGLDRPEIFKIYTAKIDKVRHVISHLIADLKARGKTIAGYGASATTTVLTYHFNLGEKLSFLIDDNPAKQRLYSPGHHIPVLPSENIYKQKPDYILVLAWRFSDMIMEKHRTYLAQGGHFIVPLPELRSF